MAESTIVIKVGGGEGNALEPVLRGVARLVQQGRRVVLVHGGSHETNVLQEALGHPAQFIRSPSGHESRRTDRRTLEIFLMAYCGKVNKTVVERLQQIGVNAVGLSGVDGRLWEGQRKAAIRALTDDGRVINIRDDLSGRVERVNDAVLRGLLAAGYVPVLTPPAISTDGQAINVDADRAAALTAAALGADALLLLSNVPGLLRRYPDESSLVREVRLADIAAAEEWAEGRMKKKVLACRDALEAGVQRAVIADSRVEHPVEAALEGAGTVFA